MHITRAIRALRWLHSAPTCVCTARVGLLFLSFTRQTFRGLLLSPGPVGKGCRVCDKLLSQRQPQSGWPSRQAGQPGPSPRCMCAGLRPTLLPVHGGGPPAGCRTASPTPSTQHCGVTRSKPSHLGLLFLLLLPVGGGHLQPTQMSWGKHKGHFLGRQCDRHRGVQRSAPPPAQGSAPLASKDTPTQGLPRPGPEGVPVTQQLRSPREASNASQ